jgi:hypothetical protein
MGDLYSILAKAIATLDPNTEEARRRLYERARAALVAETHRLAQSEAEFLSVLGSLEDAVQELESEFHAKAQRERIELPRDATSPALPRSDIAAAPRPVKPVARQRFGQFMPFFARAFRRGRDGARNLLQQPADRNEGLAGNLANEMDFDPPPDNWLSELLERASRPEHDNGGGRPPPRRGIRRNR